MSERWFHEHTPEGWEIRDENRLMVAVVPDAEHEREHDAKLIADAPRLHEHNEAIRSGIEDEIEPRRASAM